MSFRDGYCDLSQVISLISLLMIFAAAAIISYDLSQVILSYEVCSLDFLKFSNMNEAMSLKHTKFGRPGSSGKYM